VVATPAYFKANDKPRVPLDLLHHSCLRIRLPNGALHRWQFEKDGQPVQVDVQGPISLDEASLSRITVLDHVGIGYFMESDVREDIRTGRLVRVLKDWTPLLAMSLLS
jgi:DNA-binding transcriptional LysR family regulator